MLGLATGLTCAVFCIPVLIGLATRNVNKLTPFNDFSFFLLGRLIIYLLVGVIFSFIGKHIMVTDWFKGVVNLVTGGLLAYWGIRGFRASGAEKQDCSIKKYGKLMPFMAGILTGISPCPPFIAGISRIMTIGNITAGILYFTGFYITTSLFLFPSLSTILIKYKNEFKIFASLVTICFGLVFAIMGLFAIL